MKPTDEYRLRAAHAHDLQGIVDLDRSTDLLPHWSAREYSEAIDLDDATLKRCIFVAESEASIAGFAVGKRTVADDAVMSELESVAVAKSMRRRGIARALCEAVVAWAREEGAREIDLEVRRGSAQAMSLYRSLGFVEVGRRVRYYRQPIDDAVLMRLALEQAGAGGNDGQLKDL